jgi:two-component system cell cycle sensor histidine kinase PleC
MNLTGNALKFTERGSVTVTVACPAQTEDAISLRFDVADTGIGIAPHALQKLGRPFEQVESQLTKTQHGSGLGLAIAKSLVELHGGAMRIRSTLGAGTTVVVRLPLADEPLDRPKISDGVQAA